MLRTRFLCFGLALGLTAGSAFSALVINEIGTVEPTTDDEEFIELYDGGALTNLTNLQVRLINGSNGLVYDTINLSGTMPADGYFVISGGTLVPNADIQDTPATNWAQNGDPDAVQIFDNAGGVVLDAVSYFTQYDNVPGTAENLSLAGSGLLQAYEGPGGSGEGGTDNFPTQTGLGGIVQRNNITLGRFPDGFDTNSNKPDIINLFGGRTPGTSNNVYASLPLSEPFDATGLALEWGPTFAIPVVLEDSSTAIPAAIPNSPDSVSPTRWGSIKDNTGGGHQAVISSFLGRDYNVSGFFYCGAITPSPEVGALMARLNGAGVENNTQGSYDITNPIDLYGTSYYAIEVDYSTGIASAISVLNSNRLATLGSTAPLSTGWHRFAIRCEGSVVEFAVDGVQIALLTSETQRPGYAGLGYRESNPTTAGNARLNVDAISITAAAPVPVELSVFSTN